MSDGRLRAAAAALAAAGLAISIYLRIVHYDHPPRPASAGAAAARRCRTPTTRSSPACRWRCSGAIGYGLICSRCCCRATPGRFAGALLGLVAVGFSLYLTYLELFVIDAICQWCVASAVVMTALAAVTVLRLARAPPSAVAAPPPG